MLMKTAGKGANYVPGNVGLLDCLDGSQGTNCVAPFVASAEPGYCVAATANLRTGQAMGPIRTAINTRFDIYENPFFGKEKDNPDYRPAINVVKGHLGSGCNTEAPKNPADPPIAMAYPKDPCFVADNCVGGRFGSGGWYQEIDHDGDGGAVTPDTEPYWVANHPPVGGVSVPQPPDYANMTRYEVYRYEIKN
jgi:hypothetical protein